MAIYLKNTEILDNKNRICNPDNKIYPHRCFILWAVRYAYYIYC